MTLKITNPRLKTGRIEIISVRKCFTKLRFAEKTDDNVRKLSLAQTVSGTDL